MHPLNDADSNPFVRHQNPPDRFDKICKEANLPPREETIRLIGLFIAALPVLPLQSFTREAVYK